MIFLLLVLRAGLNITYFSYFYLYYIFSLLLSATLIIQELYIDRKVLWIYLDSSSSLKKNNPSMKTPISTFNFLYFGSLKVHNSTIRDSSLKLD